MDRRTIIALIALTATLFFVNYWFEQRHQEKVREWTMRQEASKKERLKKLRDEAATETAKPHELPLASLYADSQATELLTEGLVSEKAFLGLTWTQAIPDEAYLKVRGDNAVKKVQLRFKPEQGLGPVLYSSDADSKFQTAALPIFGEYNLQLLSPLPQEVQKPFTISLGHYMEGNFTLIPLEIQRLEESLEGKRSDPAAFQNSIALLKTTSGYLPVAIYDGQSRSLTPLEDFEGLSAFLIQPEVTKFKDRGLKAEEKFYVLENDYQQLVFSNYGGALAEINLPYKSKANENSVVLEIEFGREMVAEHPYNAKFPGHPYYKYEEGKIAQHDEGKLGGYYPLIRRDLVESASGKTISIPPKYYAANIVSEYPEVAELVYKVDEFTDKSITFKAVQRHRKITKKFTLASGSTGAPYVLELDVRIDGDSRGLWLASGIPEVEWISGAPAPSLKYRITRKDKPEVEKIELPSDTYTMSSAYPDWISNGNGFFGIILDPVAETEPGLIAQFVPGTVVPSRLTELAKGSSEGSFGLTSNKFQGKDMPGYVTKLPLKSSNSGLKFRLFAGPFSDEILKEADAFYANPETGYNPDYKACQTFHGWFAFISEPFAHFLNFLLKIFHNITGSWGISIILLTVALRVMLYPLNAWSAKSMAKMQQIGPEVKALQDKYKKDPKKMQSELMALYRERGANPVSGCFPLIIQLPFMVGMFDLLKSSFDLRGAGFIPGWIDNLTAPDVLFSWSTPIFFIGNQFHLLPFLVGGVMFLQQRFMSAAPADPNEMTDQQRQQRAMGNVMSVFFVLMFYNFPSGLNLYFLSSMSLAILQQWWTQKQLAKKPVPALKK